MTDTQSTEKLCSKCGRNPPAPNHKWCNRCKAAAQQGYNAISDRQSAAHEFARGAEAMREFIVKQLSNLPPAGLMQTGEVSAWVHRMERPTYAPKVMEQESLPDAP